MRLLEAIVEANQHSANPSEVTVDLQPFLPSLPIVVLTCVDPRLNRLMPGAFGVPVDQFIWLRNAGNIIFDPMSSMTRTLALSCAVKGGREIAIVGHTDCQVGKVSLIDLIDRFRAVGVDRQRLPDNLNEFFGLFASERQNVMRAVEFVRQSPLIGPKVPVHGLMVDVQTGKLEWVVNGYQTLATTAVEAVTQQSAPRLPEFKIGDMKFPDAKIGEIATPVRQPVSAPVQQPVHASSAAVEETRRMQMRKPAHEEVVQEQPEHKSGLSGLLRLNLSQMYKVMGDDQKVYGPVLGREIKKWVEEGRIDLNTLAQKVGYKNWKRLADFAEEMEARTHKGTPPTIPFDHDKRS